MNNKACGNIIRKPRLSDYNFSKETLAFLKNEEIVLPNSALKPPRLSDYDFYTINTSTKKKTNKKNDNNETKNNYIKVSSNIEPNKITPSKRFSFIGLKFFFYLFFILCCFQRISF